MQNTENGYEVTVIQNAGSIQCDFSALDNYINNRLEQYRGVIFTEDSVKDAKKTVAALRKEKKELSDRVKAVKEEFMAPLEAFCEEAGRYIQKYDEPIGFINGQVADFERQRVEDKRKLIQQLYEECIGEMADMIPLSAIYDTKWENATVNQKTIRGAMMTRKEEVKKAISTLQGMESDITEKAIELYLVDFDLADAILMINRHEQQKQAILAREQERISREEEERIRMEERRRLEAEQRALAEKEELQRLAEEEKRSALQQAEEEKQQAVEQARMEAEQELMESLIPDMEGESSLYEYRMALTADQKEKLELYMNSIGIEWEMIS